MCQSEEEVYNDFYISRWLFLSLEKLHDDELEYEIGGSDLANQDNVNFLINRFSDRPRLHFARLTQLGIPPSLQNIQMLNNPAAPLCSFLHFQFWQEFVCLGRLASYLPIYLPILAIRGPALPLLGIVNNLLQFCGTFHSASL